MIAKGSRRQMRIKRHENEKRHSTVQSLKKDMLPMGGHDMHLEHPNHIKVQDSGWEQNIKSHRSINRHPNAGTRRSYNGNPTLAQKTQG